MGEKLGMMAWYATDGGRRCPQCGRWAKPHELGAIGGSFYDVHGKRRGHLSAYGHLPGFGCNTPPGAKES